MCLVVVSNYRQNVVLDVNRNVHSHTEPKYKNIVRNREKTINKKPKTLFRSILKKGFDIFS